jgi:RHS repeat-associated protein
LTITLDGVVDGRDFIVWNANKFTSADSPPNDHVFDYIFGYTGRMFDDATGLQNNLNRWYDAKAGRWISEDPIGFDAGDANIYRFVGNSTPNFVDPTGLESDYSTGDSSPPPPEYGDSTDTYGKGKNTPEVPDGNGADDLVFCYFPITFAEPSKIVDDIFGNPTRVPEKDKYGEPVQ